MCVGVVQTLVQKVIWTFYRATMLPWILPGKNHWNRSSAFGLWKEYMREIVNLKLSQEYCIYPFLLYFYHFCYTTYHKFIASRYQHSSLMLIIRFVEFEPLNLKKYIRKIQRSKWILSKAMFVMLLLIIIFYVYQRLEVSIFTFE